MLVLKQNGEWVANVYNPSGWYTLPNGNSVSPVYDGWVGDDGYTISEEDAAPPVASTPPSIGMLKTAMLDTVRERRWNEEVNGFALPNGMFIRSDDKTQAKITGAVNLFAADPTLTVIDWETTPGNFVQLDAPTMTMIGIAVGRHVQATFTRLMELSVLINTAESVEELEAININASWPSNS